MNKLPAILVLLATALPVALSAAIPQHWIVETSRVQPAQFEGRHGETIEFAAVMQTYGKPLAITNDLIWIYWQTNGMGSAYWTAPAVLSNNVMLARWTPEMDVGANVYNCFIGAPGEIYRAAFQLRLLPSPGANPSELPLPVKTLDFSQVTVLNAPYYSKSETDARIIELAPTPGNYPAVSNAAMTAVSSEIDVGPSGNPTPILRPMKLGFGGRLYGDKLAVSWSGGKVLYGILSDFTGFSPFLTSFTESDPNVPSWAKEALKPSYTWSEIGSKPTFAAVATSGAYSDLTGKPSIPTDSTVAGWGYIKSYSESDPTVDGKISTHNSSSSAHADIRTAAANAQAHSEATRQIVYTWEDFLDGSNVVISITNYISGAYSLDHAKLQIKELLPDSNEYRIVYDSRTEITNHTAAAKREIVGYVDGVATELRDEIADKGDKAWGRRSSTGQDVPISNTVWVTEQNLRIAGGMEYERVAVGEGAIYVLTSKGQTPYMVGDEGALMLKDDGGTNYFGMVRSDSYTIGCNTDGIRVENDLVYLDFSVTMSDHPCVWYTESLGGDVEWEQLNLPDGSAVPGASHVVVWDESPRLGAQECYINCENKPGGFFRATIEVAGDARFRTNMPAEIPSFYCTDNPDKKVKIIWNNGNPNFVEAN